MSEPSKKDKTRRDALRIGLFSLASTLVCGCRKPARKTVEIAVNQIIYHPNLDALMKGFQEAVERWGADQGVRVTYSKQVANGDPALAAQIARQQASSGSALIVALGTPSAQASANATKEKPVVFGAITDPVAAGLVESLERPGRNVSGSCDIGPYAEQLKMMRKVMPNATRLGFVHNPAEANSVASTKLILPLIQAEGFTPVQVAVANAGEVGAAAQSLADRVDAFYLPADNTVLSALPALVRVAERSRKPVFVGDEGSVKLGAVATIGLNYEALGRATGKIAVRVLNGESIGTIPVAMPAETDLLINRPAAERQGIKFPEEMLKKARFIE